MPSRLLHILIVLATLAHGLRAAAAPAELRQRRPAEPLAERDRAPAVGLVDYRRGWSFGVVPLANYTSDTGFGFGAGLGMLDFGEGEESYRHALFLKGFVTTRWVQHHAFQWDAPRLGGSDVSLWLRTEFRRQLDANYFGIGNTTTNDRALVDPGSERFVSERYYHYLTMGPGLVTQLRYPLWRRLSLLAGYTFRYTYIDPYADSLLVRERPTGWEGGFTSMVHVGLELDTRDGKPLTLRGHWVELSARAATRYLGSSDDFVGLTLSDRHYWNPFGRFVLAHRLIVDVLFGDAPFYVLKSFGDAGLTDGVGGAWSLRGFAAHRFIGKVKVVLNPEIRQHILTWRWFGARFDMGAVAFFDVGRVWADLAEDGPLGRLHWGGGGGVRLVWNEAFQVRFEAAGSYEGAKLYVEMFALF